MNSLKNIYDNLRYLKVDDQIRLKLESILSRLNSIKVDVQGNNSVQQAWETLNIQMSSDNRFNVDERTMGSRNLVKELTQINLDAQNTINITQGTNLHHQKISNLCVYFAILSALRHEIKNLFKNLISNSVQSYGRGSGRRRILQASIPARKSIDELLKEKEFRDLHSKAKIPNALSFERMLSVLLGCVSPRALSGKGQNFKNKI